MFQQFILPAISFGISATTVPGPLIAYLINATLTQGWRKALPIVISPLITDIPISILMVFILGQMPSDVLKLIQLGGGLLLYYIAWGAWQQYRSGTIIAVPSDDDDTQVHSYRRILATGIMMNFLSPGPYLFWATVNGPLLVKALDQSPLHALTFLVSFYGTFMLGLSGWIFLFHYLRQVNDRYLKAIIILTIALLLWFGTSLIVSALSTV